MCDDLDPVTLGTPKQFSAALRALAAGHFTGGRDISIKTIRARIRVLHSIDRIVRDCDAPDLRRWAPFPIMPASLLELQEWLDDSDALPDPVSLGRFLDACLVPDTDVPAWQEALDRVGSSSRRRLNWPPWPAARQPDELPGTTFLCHSWGDKQQVRDLHRRLTADGVRCWLDEEDLVPGQDWERAIRQALDSAGFVLACLSTASTNTNGFVRRELDFALDRASEQPDGAIYLIPVRLEPCEVPARLQHLHHVDLFEPTGYARLFRAIRQAPRLSR